MTEIVNDWSEEYDMIEVPYSEHNAGGVTQGSCCNQSVPKLYCAFLEDRTKCCKSHCFIFNKDGTKRQFIYIKKGN